jgi:hypothetical protein
MSLSAFALRASADSNPPKLAKRAEAGRSIRATNLAKAEARRRKAGTTESKGASEPGNKSDLP